jgi:hypothetical protein
MSGITVTIGDDEIWVWGPNAVLEDQDETCPGCDHRLTNHAKDLGCQVGWAYEIEGGPSLGQGCECLLSHANLSPTERDHWHAAVMHYAPPQGIPASARETAGRRDGDSE